MTKPATLARYQHFATQIPELYLRDEAQGDLKDPTLFIVVCDVTKQDTDEACADVRWDGDQLGLFVPVA